HQSSMMLSTFGGKSSVSLYIHVSFTASSSLSSGTGLIVGLHSNCVESQSHAASSCTRRCASTQAFIEHSSANMRFSPSLLVFGVISHVLTSYHALHAQSSSSPSISTTWLTGRLYSIISSFLASSSH